MLNMQEDVFFSAKAIFRACLFPFLFAYFCTFLSCSLFHIFLSSCITLSLISLLQASLVLYEDQVQTAATPLPNGQTPFLLLNPSQTGFH